MFGDDLVFGGDTGIILQCLLFVNADELRIGFDEPLVEDTARQRFVVVILDRLEIERRDSGLFGDLADREASLLAGALQFFS